jgi:hypothetical protein
MSTSTSGGEHYIKISFETLEQMQESRDAILSLINAERAR